MKSLVLLLLLHLFYVTHGRRHQQSFGNAHAAREAINEQIKRAMSGETYLAKTLLHSFDFGTVSVNTDEADEFCEQRGGRRMNLNSKAKWDIFVKQSEITNDWHWTGAKRESPKAEYYWSTGELVEPSNIQYQKGYEDGLCMENRKNAAFRYYCGSTKDGSVACEYDSWVFPISGYTTIKASTSLIAVAKVLDYNQAEAKCKEMFVGGKLATPSNFKMLETIDALIGQLDSQQQYWLGASRNRTLDTNWNDGYPIVGNLRKIQSENGGDCLIYNADIKQFDFINCGVNPYGFICQIDQVQ